MKSLDLLSLIMKTIVILLSKRSVKAAEKKEDLEIPEPLPLPEDEETQPVPVVPASDKKPPEDPKRVFKEALGLTLKYEGGYVNHPNDPGGATNKGVTQAVYDQYRREKNKAIKSVKKISEEEVEEVYYQKYWLKGRCDKLPECLAIVHFDTSVNSGIKQSSKFIQRAIGTVDDGAIGPKTLTAIRHAMKNLGEMAVVNHFLDQRRRFFELIARKNPKLKVFLKGWMKRVAALESYIGPYRLMYASNKPEEEKNVG